MDVKPTIQQAPYTKYQIEISFLGSVDDQQAEEEIVTLLKRNFLEKVTSDTTNKRINHNDKDRGIEQ